MQREGGEEKYGKICRGDLFTVDNFEYFLLENSEPLM